MKIILTKDIIKLGNKGEIVNVKSGYARNFLLPKLKAIYYNKNNNQKKNNKECKLFFFNNEIFNKIKEIKIIVKANLKGELFGSIKNIDVANIINKKLNNIKLDKLIIILPNNKPIYKLGTYIIEIIINNIKKKILLKLLTK